MDDCLKCVSSTCKSKITKKVWGYEYEIVNGELYCGKFLNLKSRYQCSLHYHKLKTETFYILKGKVLMEINYHKFIMTEGDSVTIYPGEHHRFTGKTWFRNSVILEVSTQHFDDDSYRIIYSRRVI